MRSKARKISLNIVTAFILLYSFHLTLFSQPETGIEGFQLLHNNTLDNGYSYFCGTFFNKSGMIVLPAINNKGQSLVRYYKLNRKGVLKFKDEEDVFIPESYELTGSLNMTADKNHFVFSAMNGTMREPDLFYAEYNEVWKHYTIRVLGEVNFYNSVEKNPIISADGNHLYFLEKGSLVKAIKKPGAKVFDFPEKLEFENIEKGAILAFDLSQDENEFILVSGHQLFSAKETARGTWKATQFSSLNTGNYQFLGFNYRDNLILLYLKTTDGSNNYELLVYKTE